MQFILASKKGRRREEMKKKMAPLVIILPLILSTFMMSRVGAQDTTFGVEPPVVSDEAFVAGSDFAVELWIRDFTDLTGFEFKLAYDTTVLTATEIEYGGIFGETYWPLINVIYDEEGWLGFSCMQMFGEDPVDGSGRAAILNFTVDSYGSSILDLYETNVGNSTGGEMAHIVIDGYFSNKIPGDIDGDGDVDPFDFSTFRLAYGSTAGQESYDLECDLDQDGDVDPFDFSTFRLNYGRT